MILQATVWDGLHCHVLWPVLSLTSAYLGQNTSFIKCWGTSFGVHFTLHQHTSMPVHYSENVRVFGSMPIQNKSAFTARSGASTFSMPRRKLAHPSGVARSFVLAWHLLALRVRLRDMSGTNIVLWPDMCPARPGLYYITGPPSADYSQVKLVSHAFCLNSPTSCCPTLSAGTEPIFQVHYVVHL